MRNCEPPSQSRRSVSFGIFSIVVNDFTNLLMFLRLSFPSALSDTNLALMLSAHALCTGWGAL